MNNNIKLKTISPIKPSPAGRNAEKWIVTYTIKFANDEIEIHIPIEDKAPLTANEATALAWSALGKSLNALCVEVEQSRSEHGRLAK